MAARRAVHRREVVLVADLPVAEPEGQQDDRPDAHRAAPLPAVHPADEEQLPATRKAEIRAANRAPSHVAADAVAQALAKRAAGFILPIGKAPAGEGDMFQTTLLRPSKLNAEVHASSHFRVKEYKARDRCPS